MRLLVRSHERRPSASDGHRDPKWETLSNTHGNSRTDADANAFTNADSDSQSNANAECHTNSDTYAHAHADASFDARNHAFGFAEPGAARK